jgi:hypothetical protein
VSVEDLERALRSFTDAQAGFFISAVTKQDAALLDAHEQVWSGNTRADRAMLLGRTVDMISDVILDHKLVICCPRSRDSACRCATGVFAVAGGAAGGAGVGGHRSRAVRAVPLPPGPGSDARQLAQQGPRPPALLRTALARRGEILDIGQWIRAAYKSCASLAAIEQVGSSLGIGSLARAGGRAVAAGNGPEPRRARSERRPPRVRPRPRIAAQRYL